MDTLAKAFAAYPKIQFRYILKQRDGFSGKDELNMDGDFTWPAQLSGRTDAQNALAGVDGANVRDYIYEWNQNESIRNDFPQAADFVAHRQHTESLTYQTQEAFWLN